MILPRGVEMSSQQFIKNVLTEEQRTSLIHLASRYNEKVNWDAILVGVSGLPSDWIMCTVGPITVGISPKGKIHS
jgi:hypothetical protein